MNKEIKAFEEKFDNCIKEVLVLTETGTSARRCAKEKMWTAQVTVLAVIDMKTDELIEGKRRLTWLLTDQQCNSKEKIFELEAESIYQLKVQESFAFTNPFSQEVIPQEESYLVREVVERNCYDSRLEEIRKKYQLPVTLHTKGCSALLLDKSLGIFSGNGVWNSCQCTVHFDVDHEGAETAKEALCTWDKLLLDCAEWDRKARSYAAKELMDTANSWILDAIEEDEEIEEITERVFAERMVLSEIAVSIEGDFTIYYEDDDMFWGHIIMINGNIDRGLEDAAIAG
ncbi:MAG: DUF2262 domain-containing protein [Lachnospiraceae bacterium]|nr:DUF2262 domain-containing protein [Lachnospiraceae bacterium]